MIQRLRQNRLTGRGGRADLLRAALLALAALGLLGTAGELALARHWHDWIQLLPWFALGGACLGLVALLASVSAWSVRLARIMATVTVAMAGVGIWQHLAANYDTAPLDGRYTDRWESMSLVERWWEIALGEVGVTPILAAGVLLQIGLALAAATIGLNDAGQEAALPSSEESDSQS